MPKDALALVSPDRDATLDFAEDSDLDVEHDLDIEQCSHSGESGLSSEGGLDVLCLETACSGVLSTLWCELTTYARSYGVPKHVLRAMVECAFLHELNQGSFFVEFEEDPEPLTRLQYLKTLERARRIEEARVVNAKYPYKVPDDKWRELLAKAKTR